MSGPKAARSRITSLSLLLPALLVVGLFCFAPVASIAQDSVTNPEPGFGNYIRLFRDEYSFASMRRTLFVAVAVTVLTLVIAYPYAYAMATARSVAVRALLLTLALMPFWTSMMARNFAWVALMQGSGLIASAFGALGLDGVVLIRTRLGVIIAMTQVLLPFMILPLANTMQQIDRTLMSAARGLGAPRIQAFRTVFLPLSAPGVVAGAALVFILSLGFYITPAMLGSPQDALVAQVMAIRVQTLLDFPGAGALGIVILVATLLALALSRLLFRRPVGTADQTTGG